MRVCFLFYSHMTGRERTQIVRLCKLVPQSSNASANFSYRGLKYCAIYCKDLSTRYQTFTTLSMNTYKTNKFLALKPNDNT